MQRITADFTLRGLVAELAERGVKVDYRTVWKFVHAERLSFKKKAFCQPSKTGRELPAAGCSGRNTKEELIHPGWSLSMRLGQYQLGAVTWMVPAWPETER